MRFFGDLEGLLSKFQTERKIVFMQQIAQTLRHSQRASQEHDLSSGGIRLTHPFSQFFDAAMPFWSGLGAHKELRNRRRGLRLRMFRLVEGADLFEPDHPMLRAPLIEILRRQEKIFRTHRHPLRIDRSLVALLDGREESSARPATTPRPGPDEYAG